MPSRSGDAPARVMCGWAGSDGRCGRALRGTLATGTDGYSPRRLGARIALSPLLWHSAVVSATDRLLDRCTAAFPAPQCLLDRCRSAFWATDRLLGDGSHSGCRCLFWARFKFGFDRNCAELGHPRPEAETPPRKRPHRGFGLLDLSRRQPPACRRPPRPPASAARAAYLRRPPAT